MTASSAFVSLKLFPIIVYFLSKAGIVSPNSLIKYRKYAIIIILIIFSVFTVMFFYYIGHSGVTTTVLINDYIVYKCFDVASLSVRLGEGGLT